jgi:hypothetical protein
MASDHNPGKLYWFHAVTGIRKTVNVAISGTRDAFSVFEITFV